MGRKSKAEKIRELLPSGKNDDEIARETGAFVSKVAAIRSEQAEWKPEPEAGDIAKADLPDMDMDRQLKGKAETVVIETTSSMVGPDMQPIISTDEFYSGCYGRASINFYAFSVDGNKGIAAGLNNVQKLADGERLGGGSRASDDFTAVEDDFLN
jgi:hypothetical protein